ncbi:MAG TPA: transcription repressor NadR [Actinomycetota bacterium]|nr:transcription repressor NadR [Actinomycetota bacterium]
MSEGNGTARREKIVTMLRESRRAITGSELAERFGVSRQAIVNDMAIIRAGGAEISGGTLGYRWDGAAPPEGVFAVLACEHDREGATKELEVLVAHGCTVLDVVVDHPLYGELRAPLNIGTHRDVERYAESVRRAGAEPLSSLTAGVHRHSVRAPDEVALESARRDLALLGCLRDEADPAGP